MNYLQGSSLCNARRALAGTGKSAVRIGNTLRFYFIFDVL